MPTIKVNISPYERSDGRFQVRIRIIQNKKAAFIKTPYYIESSDIDRNGEIIPLALRIELKDRIRKIEKKMYELGDKLDTMTIHELINYLDAPAPSEINLISYFKEKIDSFAVTKAPQTVKGYYTALDRFVAFYGEETLEPGTFTVRLLNDFEINLRTVPGKEKKVITGTTIRLYMTYLSTLASIAEKEDVITRNPFRKGYVKPQTNHVEKRNIDIETLRKLIHATPESDLERMAIDVIVISFMLCGMNTADIYACPPAKRGRIEYQRSKTKTRRKDKALISILIQPELREYLERHSDKEKQFNFHKLYSNAGQFNKRVNKGLSTICKRIEIQEITTYYIRHTFATIARNELGISKDDIHLALNHSSAGNVTDLYLATDWSIIDRVNRKLIDYLMESKGGMKVVKLAN